jgi:four helix bundle protein
MAYYQKLIVWQKAFLVADLVYKLTNNFPLSQRYSLANQIERSAVSIMSNIAEGSRRSKKEWLHFIRIAFGSTSELESQLLLAKKQQFGDEKLYCKIFNELNHISRILNSILYNTSR